MPAVEDVACYGCHPQVAAQGARHTHHRSKEANRCVACHMPKVVRGVLDRFADHALDVPVPLNTDRHGVPNACGECHRDRSPAALSQSLLQRWPDAARRQQRRLVLADAIDEATAAQSLPALLTVLAKSDEAPSLRGACALLVAQRFPRAAPPALLPLLRAGDALLRSRAIEALGFARAQAAASAIAPLLDDESLMVRQTAAVVLASLGDGRGEPALRRLLQAPRSAGLVQPHFVLGNLAARRGDLTTAAAELERAVDLMPYFTDALLMLAEVYFKRGEVPRARARLLEVLYFSPHDPHAQKRLNQLSAPEYSSP